MFGQSTIIQISNWVDKSVSMSMLDLEVTWTYRYTGEPPVPGKIADSLAGEKYVQISEYQERNVQIS